MKKGYDCIKKVSNLEILIEEHQSVIESQIFQIADLLKRKYALMDRLAGLSERPVAPVIVCLCGSTKFKQEFIQTNREETLKGHIVLSVGLFGHADNLALSDNRKTMLDELHKRKIDLSNEILVLNVCGYIGKSTASEIKYAEANNKKVRYLEAVV